MSRSSYLLFINNITQVINLPKWCRHKDTTLRSHMFKYKIQRDHSNTGSHREKYHALLSLWAKIGSQNEKNIQLFENFSHNLLFFYFLYILGTLFFCY